jgi:hypothetical protein
VAAPLAIKRKCGRATEHLKRNPGSHDVREASWSAAASIAGHRFGTTLDSHQERLPHIFCVYVSKQVNEGKKWGEFGVFIGKFNKIGGVNGAKIGVMD